MSLWDDVDLDKVLKVVLEDVGYAVNGWLNGRPLDKVALMNRITEVLARRRRGCDIGNHIPVIVSCRVALLHRQGQHQTDNYGSDLAVTVYTDNRDFIKTAFFQLKRSTNLSAVLESHQVREALRDRRVGDRAFVLAVDETRYCIRLRQVTEIVNEFPLDQGQRTYTTSDWSPLSRWVMEWMECSVGPNSSRDDPNSAEALLQEFAVEQPLETPWGRTTDHDLPDNYLPARAWLQAEFIRRPF